MENKATEQNEQDRLEKTTVRFTKGALSVIDELAEMNGRTRAEIIRLVVDNRLASYLPKVTFVEHEDALQYRKELADLLTVMEDIRNELHRIGVNYNQELKMKHIKAKYGDLKNMNYDTIAMRRRELDEVEKNTKTLNKQELEQLMQRFEQASQKVGEALCRTLE